MDLACYDRSGVPISLETYGRLMADPAYKHVRRTTIASAADPAVAYDVSTVWLGIDHAFGTGLPLIFETMVFGAGSLDLYCDRYPTEAAARTGHTETVTVVAATMDDPIVMDAHERELGPL